MARYWDLTLSSTEQEYCVTLYDRRERRPLKTFRGVSVYETFAAAVQYGQDLIDGFGDGNGAVVTLADSVMDFVERNRTWLEVVYDHRNWPLLVPRNVARTI